MNHELFVLYDIEITLSNNYKYSVGEGYRTFLNEKISPSDIHSVPAFRPRARGPDFPNGKYHLPSLRYFKVGIDHFHYMWSELYNMKMVILGYSR